MSHHVFSPSFGRCPRASRLLQVSPNCSEPSSAFPEHLGGNPHPSLWGEGLPRATPTGPQPHATPVPSSPAALPLRLEEPGPVSSLEPVHMLPLSLEYLFFLHFSTQLAPLIHSSPCSKVTFSERNLENRLLPASPRVPHTPSSHIVSMIPPEALLSPHGPRALLSARWSQASWAFCVAAGFLEAAAVPTRRSDLDSVTFCTL